MLARATTPDDAEAIAQIYNQGIEDRIATFETRLRSAEDVRAWFDGRHPVVVVEDGGRIVGFAATSLFACARVTRGLPNSRFTSHARRWGGVWGGRRWTR